MTQRQEQRSAVSIGDIGQFMMELASLMGIGLIGWNLGQRGILGAVLAIAFILATGAVWGRFRTPGFVPNGSEPARPISGPARTALELAVYALGILGLWWSGRESTAAFISILMVLTLILSRKRYMALWATRV